MSRKTTGTEPAGVIAAAVLVWLLGLVLVLVWPWLVASPTAGDDLTRHTVRLSLLYYAAALTLMIRRGTADRLARWCWTLAWAAFVVHLGMAFHLYYHWSHDDAVRHTREVSGVGEGIYVSYLFALVWSADVAMWWLRPAWYARRSPWVGRALHGFMLFVVLNATVVYESGFIRWAGVALFVWLAAVLLLRRRAAAGGAHSGGGSSERT